MTPRKLFIAGSTGAVGRTVVRLADASGKVDFVAHVRPKHSGEKLHPRAAAFDLADAGALDAALRGCTTVLQLIGTIRSRFAQGDTYETSDIGTTRLLVEAAKRVGTVDHIVLLSSVGAGRPFGAYLRAKAAAEALVVQSDIAHTIFRPSGFMGEGHRPPPGARLFGALLGSRFKPIAVDDLARAILHCALENAPLDLVLEGDGLWAVVGAARAAVLYAGS